MGITLAGQITLSGQASAQSPPGNAASGNAADTEDDAATPTSSPEALAAYAKAATFQNNRAFDLAADAWRTFLEKYAGDPKATEAKYNLGVCLLELKSFADARDQLQAALADGVSFPRREEAFLNLGWAQYTLGLQDQPESLKAAAATFAKQLEEFPQGSYRDQALFLRGESVYLQGDRVSAVTAYQTLVDEFPDSEFVVNGLYALGVTQEELGNYEAAGAIYDRYLDKAADQPLANEVKMRRAETFLQTGDLQTAEQRFREVAELSDFASADHAAYRLGYCLARQERYADAADQFAALVQRFPESRYKQEATLAAARSYYRAEQKDAAGQWFEKLLSVDSPYASEAAHWLARLALDQKQPEQALERVESQLPAARDGNHPFLVNLLLDQADALYEIPARRAEAIPLYLQINTQFPSHMLAPQALYNAAFGSLELKQFEKAVELATDFVKKYPDHRLMPDVKHVVAECQLQLGDASAAAVTFSELTADNSERPEADRWQLRRALALYVDKQYAEVLKLLEEQIDKLTAAEDLAEAYYLVGMSHFGLEDFEPARVALEQSLAKQPRWRQADEAWLNLSRTLRKLGRLEPARDAAQRVVDEFPESEQLAQAYFRLAECEYALGNYDAAIANYEQVIQREPESTFVPYAWYGIGWSQLRSARLDEAEVAFDQLLQNFSSHALSAQARYARAMTRQQAGRFEQALEDIDAYLQGDRTPRERSDALYVRGLSLAGLDRFEPAVEVLQSVIALDPKYGSADKVLYELAWAQKQLGQDAAARGTFERLAREYGKSPLAAEAFFHVAEGAYEAGDFAVAAESYQAARERATKDKDLGEKIRYKLGWSSYQAGEFAQAREAFAEQAAEFPQGALVGDAHFMQGECCFKLNDFESALQHFRDAQQHPLSSEQIATLNDLHAGQAAGQIGDWQQSQQWLTKLLEKFPESPYRLEATYELAVAAQNLQQVEEAEAGFREVADQGAGELAARARFMLGEVLYAKGEYADAVREFRKVMFGFDAQAEASIKRWQAKAGFEAGQCAGVLASQQRNRRQQQQYIDLAIQFFQYVQTRHADTEEAAAASEQLKKYSGG